MFDLANNRLSYSELLRPDAGYTLDHAVGMTYSLDLEALIGVPVSLGLLDQTDSESMRNPLYILEAIRRSADHITLFCNAGSIQLPRKIEPVYSLLENSVFPVRLPKHSNFHPKIWVLKFSREGRDPYIKLLVMSRNLTFDSSIDISVAMQGFIGKEETPKHKPLADLLQFVSNYAGRKKQEVLALAGDILRVPAFEVSAPFDDKAPDNGYDLFPIGIPGYEGKDIPLFRNKQDLFCVSPFLSDDTVQKLVPTRENGGRCLVTRKESVTPAVWEAFNHNIYVTKEILNDNEYGAKQDIHAKIYYTTTREGNYLYLGSANASVNAYSRNVEFLLRLRYKLNHMGYKVFFSDFIPEENCPYTKLVRLPEQDKENSEKTEQKEIDDALREAVYAVKHAAVTREEKGYSVRVEAKKLKTPRQVMIAPLQCPGMKRKLDEQVEFSGLLLKHLSEFYILSTGEQELIVKIRTSGIPKDRDQAVYRSIIDTKSKFMRYLSFALTDELPGEPEEPERNELSVLQSGGLQSKAKSSYAVYEQLLRVFHRNPGRIKGIADMIRRLDPEVVGDDFIEMFRLFEDTAKKVHRS